MSLLAWRLLVELNWLRGQDKCPWTGPLALARNRNEMDRPPLYKESATAEYVRMMREKYSKKGASGFSASSTAAKGTQGIDGFGLTVFKNSHNKSVI